MACPKNWYESCCGTSPCYYNDKPWPEGVFSPPCPINCSGGCPTCAPDEHTGKAVMLFLLEHFTFVNKEQEHPQCV